MCDNLLVLCVILYPWFVPWVCDLEKSLHLSLIFCVSGLFWACFTGLMKIYVLFLFVGIYVSTPCKILPFVSKKKKPHWWPPHIHPSLTDPLPHPSIAAAFSRVVNSFVSDMLLPIISLIPGLGRNFDDLFAVLRRGDGGSSSSLSPGGLTVNGEESTWQSKGYNTVKQANDDGALVLAYG